MYFYEEIEITATSYINPSPIIAQEECGGLDGQIDLKYFWRNSWLHSKLGTRNLLVKQLVIYPQELIFIPLQMVLDVK